MKIGFFGGGFNPISNVHINIAENLVMDNYIDKVMFVPVGDLYNKKGLIVIDNFETLTQEEKEKI